MTRSRCASLLALATLVAVTGRAAAAPGELRHDWRTDGAITLVGGGLWILSETALKGHLAPARCRWCEPNPVDTGARNGLRWSRPEVAHLSSNVIGFVVVPASALGLTALVANGDGRLSGWPVDALIVLEATVLAVDLNQLVKFAVGRERPFVHALDGDAKRRTARPSDNDLSFYSGHTTFTFALAVSSGTVASLRDYPRAWLVWGAGLGLAASTGYLRIAADKHYLTDVLTGAALGAAVGFLVPYVLHRPDPQAPAGTAARAPAPLLGWGLAW